MNTDQHIEENQHIEKKRSGFFRNLLGIVIIVAIVLCVVRLLNTFVYQMYTIPSGSMEQTINVGDRVFAEKISYYFSPPKVGDIVTFTDPKSSDRILIKRCVAVGGQTVDLQNGKLVVDGVVQDEPYTRGQLSYPLYGSTITYPYTVPNGCIWVMGDNRTNSQDSRYFGAIKTSTVLGHAVFKYWPISAIGPLS